MSEVAFVSDGSLRESGRSVRIAESRIERSASQNSPLRENQRCVRMAESRAERSVASQNGSRTDRSAASQNGAREEATR